MKYLKHIKQYFYSEENKYSNIQIIEDFGGSYPFPLNCKNLEIEFTIVKTRGIGGLYANLLSLNRSIQAEKIISTYKNQFTNQLDSIKEIYKKIFLVVIIMPILFLFAILAFFAFIFFLIYLLININYKLSKSLGYFVPNSTDERHIALKIGSIKSKKDIEPIISHEHIHLLQYRNKKFSINKKTQNEKCNEILLVEELKNNSHYLYLLEQNEVEARLHEIIISYYRNKNILPLTIKGFVEILAGSNKFGLFITKTMAVYGVVIKQDIATYNERSEKVAKDMEDILFAIKDIDLIYRFITEVLPVMYGNLLKYYGDDESSINFLNKIDRPNLYDMIYS